MTNRKELRNAFHNLILCGIVSLVFILFMAVPTYASAVDTNGNTANVVVFVGFADTSHDHSASGFGKCFLEDPNIDKLFNGVNGNPEALRQYIFNISYGMVQVANIFPQYDDATGKIEPFVLSGTAAYYAGNGDLLVKDTVEALAQSGRLSGSINIDYDNDNLIDNLMVVVPCESGNVNELFIGKHSSYAGVSAVNGKRAADYTIITESGAYLGLSQSCLLIHEYMHTLGYLDLYRHRAGETSYANNPVYTWDIMSAEGLYPQYPLAYQRSKVGGYFSIPEISQSQSGISIYSASVSAPFSYGNENELISEEIKNHQAVILRTGYSDTEFFVVEYRRQGGTKWATPAEGGPMKQVSASYDRKIPGSGIIIYRVNLDTPHASNLSKDPYYIYVFRPGDTIESDGIESAAGDIVSKSFLSKECGRTSYGSSDMSVGLEGGALTYSDGHNSGIVISNVGSASGDTISFDVTIPEVKSGEVWKTEYASDTDETHVGSIASMDSEEKIYVLQYNYSSGSLYTNSDGKLIEIAGSAISGDFTSGSLVNYKGEIYAVYIGSDKVNLSKWTGTRWNILWTSSEMVNSGSYNVCTDENGIYIVYADSNIVNSVQAYKYDGKLMSYLGNAAVGCKYAANPKITAKGGIIAIAYREFNNASRVTVKKYINQSWTDISLANISADYLGLATDGNNVYLGRYTMFPTSYQIWRYSAPGEWQQIGTDVVTGVSVSEMDLAVNKDCPYTVFNDATNNSLLAYIYNKDTAMWEMVNNKVMSESIIAFNQYLNGNKMWVSLFSSNLHKTLIKSTLLSDLEASDDEPLVNENRINSVSLTLNGDIGVNFYMSVSPKVSYVKMKSEKGEEKTIFIDDCSKEHCFTYAVSAKEIEDSIILSAYDESGDLVPICNELCADGAYVYSVRDYLDYVLDEENGMALSQPELYDLCRAMKKYGLNAKVYFGYKSENLQAEDSSCTDVSSYEPRTYGDLPEGIKYVGTSLLLKSTTCIRHYFALEGGHSIKDYQFTIEGETVRPLSNDSGIYYVQIDSIPAPDLAKYYSLEILRSGNTQGYTMGYCALCYVNKVHKATNDDNLTKLVDSLREYGDASFVMKYNQL